MPADFLDYYRKNLQSLRSAAADFAHAYPKIAANLALDNFACADPFVERLLEGSAFIASQVEAHLDSGYARLLQQLVTHSAPLFNTPLPALACVQLSAQQSGQLPLIAAGQSFTLPTVKGQNCTFSALWPAAVHPLSAHNWVYHHNVADELPELGLGAQAKSVLACELTLKVPASAARSWLELQRQQQPQAAGLELFCNMPESTAASLYQLWRHDQIAVYVRTTELNGRTKLQQLAPVTCVASLYQQPSYLQEVVGGAAALDYLALYLNYPQLCKFIRLHGLLEQWLKLNLSSGRLIVVFKRELNIPLELSILTNVVPLINIFSARSNRTALTLRSDYQIQIDRTHPLDYEVLAISALECYDQQQRLRFVAHPLTGLRPIPDTPEVSGVSFSCERRLPQVRPNPRSPYPISNMFVALSGPAYRQAYSAALAALEPKLLALQTAQQQAAIRELGLDLVAQCYCSNGDLPYFLAQDASVRSSNDELHGTILGDVTKMVTARLTSVSDDELKLLSLVLINTTALLRQPDSEVVAYLRSLLLVLGNHSLEVEQLAQCLVSFKREAQTFRRIKQGVVFFEEGARLTVTLDESKLGGSGLMFVAELWAQVLLSALAVNTPAQVKVSTTDEEEVGVWQH